MELRMRQWFVVPLNTPVPADQAPDRGIRCLPRAGDGLKSHRGCTTPCEVPGDQGVSHLRVTRGVPGLGAGSGRQKRECLQGLSPRAWQNRSRRLEAEGQSQGHQKVPDMGRCICAARPVCGTGQHPPPPAGRGGRAPTTVYCNQTKPAPPLLAIFGKLGLLAIFAPNPGNRLFWKSRKKRHPKKTNQ